MGGADQAFQVIQEYSGFVYPGIVVIFGLGLLWKRASGVAAVVTAIGTFAFSILFKLILPEVPFLLRMGYVFICLVVMFFGLSFLSGRTKPAEKLAENVVKTQLKYAYICLISAVVCFVIGIVSIFSTDMQNLGFEAVFFLGAMMLSLFIYLRSNALDKVEDVNSIGVDIEIFRTDRTFNIGAAGVIIILVILYSILW